MSDEEFDPEKVEWWNCFETIGSVKVVAATDYDNLAAKYMKLLSLYRSKCAEHKQLHYALEQGETAYNDLNKRFAQCAEVSK